MIEVKNIIKRYGTLEVLKGVSVCTAAGLPVRFKPLCLTNCWKPTRAKWKPFLARVPVWCCKFVPTAASESDLFVAVKSAVLKSESH